MSIQFLNVNYPPDGIGRAKSYYRRVVYAPVIYGVVSNRVHISVYALQWCNKLYYTMPIKV